MKSNKNGENKQLYYLYFIESHEQNKELDLFLDKKENNFNSNYLELIFRDEMKSTSDKKYDIFIYRFRIYPKNIKNENKSKKIIITVKLRDENNVIFESKINTQGIEEDKNYFLFDFKFEHNKKLFKTYFPPKSIYITNRCKFVIFMKFLKDNYNILKGEKEIDDLIYYTLKIIDKDFFFYTYILIECYEYKECLKKLLLLFVPEELIVKINNINKEKLNEFKDKINELTNNIEKAFEHIGNDKELEFILLSFIFTFNYYFQKEQIFKMLNNNIIKEQIYEIILMYSNVFKNLELNKECLLYILKKVSSYDKISGILLLNNNFLDLLEIINNSELKILSKLSSFDKTLELENYVVPKIEDNLNEIYNQIKILLLNELILKKFLIKFSDDIFDKYIELYQTRNIEDLILIYKIMIYIKKNDIISDIKNIHKIKALINIKFFELIKTKKINNILLLNYLENYELYTCSELLQNIDYFNFQEIDTEFFIKWKKIDWLKVCKDNKNEFYKKICSHIQNKKDFGILFNLFDIFKTEKDYEKECLENMQEKFILINNSNPSEENSDFVENIIDLIYYSENKNIDVTSLINNNILNNYSDEIIDKIFKGLIKKKLDYSNELTNILLTYFSKNIEKSNVFSIIFILKNYKTQLEIPSEDRGSERESLQKNVFSYLDNFIFNKEEFFSLEQNEKIKLYSNLLKMGMLNETYLPNSDYYVSCISLVYKLSNDLKTNNLEYIYINPFYINNKENILYNRLLLLSNNNEEEANKFKKTIDECIQNSNNILRDLNTINDYLTLFFEDSQKEKINEINDIINNIKNKNINYYKSIYQKYLEIAHEFKNDANENAKFANIYSFKIIYKNLLKINHDENKSLLDAKKYIDIMKNVLEKNNIENIDKDELYNYIKYLNLKQNIFMNDINNLILIYNLENKINKENLSKELSLLSQKEIIILIVNKLIYLIEQLALKKTEFFSVLNIIKNNLNKSKRIYIIEFCKSLLHNYKIDIDYIEDRYLDILIDFDKYPEKINFLLDNNQIETFKKKIKTINEENNNSFECIEKCILYINKLKSENNKILQDKDIISIIINEIYNEKNFYFYLYNYLDKFELLKEL